MTNPATTSLLDRADLDRDAVAPRGRYGASTAPTMASCSSNIAQTEALMFDNGRLKQATYDTSQGFGLRAVKDEAVGYAHSSDLSDAGADPRGRCGVARSSGGYSGTFAARAGSHQRPSLRRREPARTHPPSRPR